MADKRRAKPNIRAVTGDDDDLRHYLSPIEAIIDDIAAGKMVILVDDEGRENEGDLVIAGEKAATEAINFMATHGRGLICLSLAKDRIEQLGLPLMTQDNKAPLQTAFTAVWPRLPRRTNPLAGNRPALFFSMNGKLARRRARTDLGFVTRFP